ncbi:MAG: helix-turn-helix domain-containing protein [Firmicutes bacterium]|nr:helix-turn-helix domain-containing protein [Bacillota bacterium]
MKIGSKIQKHRASNGLSQEALAEKLSVTRQTVSKWELGQALPEIDKIIAMSRLFRTTTDELLIDELNSQEELQMENVLHCQSCYMPMDVPDKFGEEKDGSQNRDYCCHCYKDGDFTSQETLEQAVESNIPWWKSEEESDDVARERIMKVFPTLKRWKTS